MEYIMPIKYPELQNKDWLIEHYVTRNLSSPHIAKILNCDKGAVVKALRRQRINVRTNSEAQSLVRKPSKYKLLNDKDWLYKKYITEGFSTVEIAHLAGIKQPNSVRQFLIKHEIPVRDVSDGLTYMRADDGLILNHHSVQVIEGGLLGDSSMWSYNWHSNLSYPMLKRKNKHLDHVQYVATEMGISHSRIKSEIAKLNGKKYKHYVFKTLVHKELLSMYRKWYPSENNFVKSVPSDFVLTPISLLHWYMDDGTSSYRIRSEPQYKSGEWKQRVKSIRLSFCSESFTRSENEFLVEQLKKLGVTAQVIPYPSGTGWRIKIPSSKTHDFFDVIGPCPVSSLAYRWKWKINTLD